MLYQVTVIHDMQGLIDLKDEWESLQANSSQKQNIFFSWEWISTFWQHFHETGQLWLIQVRDLQGQLVGLLPMMRKTWSGGLGLSWQRLEFIALPYGAVHGDFIIADGHQEPTMQALMAWFQQSHQWGEAFFECMRDASTTVKTFQSGDLNLIMLEQRECPYVSIEGTWGNFFNNLSKTKRKDSRRSWRKLDDEFPNQWSWRRIDDPEEVPLIMDHLMEGHQAKWESLGEPGNFFNDALRAFHRDVAERCARRGWLWLYELKINDDIVALDYNFAYEGQVYGFAGSTNPDYSGYGPGNLMTEIVLRECFEHGMKVYDFMMGDHDYKLRWGTVNELNIVVSFPCSPQSKAYRQMLETTRTIWKRGKHLVPKSLGQKLRGTILKRFSR